MKTLTTKLTHRKPGPTNLVMILCFIIQLAITSCTTLIPPSQKAATSKDGPNTTIIVKDTHEHIYDCNPWGEGEQSTMIGIKNPMGSDQYSFYSVYECGKQ